MQSIDKRLSGITSASATLIKDRQLKTTSCQIHYISLGSLDGNYIYIFYNSLHVIRRTFPTAFLKWCFVSFTAASYRAPKCGIINIHCISFFKHSFNNLSMKSSWLVNNFEISFNCWTVPIKFYDCPGLDSYSSYSKKPSKWCNDATKALMVKLLVISIYV